MRLCNNAGSRSLSCRRGAFAACTTIAPAKSAAGAGGRLHPLTVDRDPVRSPDGDPPPPSEPLHKQGEGYVLHTDVEEVVLNCHRARGQQAGPRPEEGQLRGL